MIPFFTSVSKRQRRQFAALLVLSSLSFYFTYHLLNGNNGLFAMIQLNNKLVEAQARLDEIKFERLKLQHKVSMLSPESLDLDLLDEEARKNLGYAKPNEIIIFLPE